LTGELLTIAIDDVGGLPGAVLVAGTADLRAVRIRPGMAVAATPAGLSIPAAAVTVEATSARVWSAALPASARLTAAWVAGGDLAHFTAVARRLAAARAPSAGLGPWLAGLVGPDDPWLGAARVRIERHRWAFGAEDLASILGEAVELIGLGPGLTPSGDDYLVGLLAGLDATDHRARPALATAIAYAAPTRTTAIGSALLAHAVRGSYAERLHDVLTAIGAGDVGAISRSVDRAMAYGATSGADTLAGLFVALEVGIAGRAGTRSAAA